MTSKSRWLSLIAAAIFALWTLHSTAQSETYADFTAKLLDNLPGGARFRPDLELLLVQLANERRSAAGRAPLERNSLFLSAARAHATDMMIHGFVGHRASTGHDFDSRIRAFAGDITRFPALAENAARDTGKGPANAAKAGRLFQQWMGSRRHRHAMLKLDFDHVATGVVEWEGSLWAVQIFWARPRQKGMLQ